jgi:uncharacterized protein YwqG
VWKTLQTMDGADLPRYLAEHKLDEWAPRLLATERWSIRLVPLGGGQQTGRLGGSPRLGLRDIWPEADGRPLSFIAEIDLAAAASLLPGADMPPSGFLEFFYDAEQTAWGFDPVDRPKWRVLLVGGDAPERVFPADLPIEARFAEVPLEGRVEVTFTDWESWRLDEMHMDTDERRRYAEALDAWKETREANLTTIHRLLGHPDPIQGDMMLECQLASNGIYTGSPRRRSETEALLESGARDWRLLLQVDSEERSGMMWGDVGRLYYWIRAEDLREGRWDRVWMILQCA